MIADFMILIFWLQIFITRANLTNDALNQVLVYEWKLLKKVSILSQNLEIEIVPLYFLMHEQIC